MKNIFFPLSVLLSLCCLCSCNSSNNGTTKQNEAQAVPELKSIFINGDSIHYIDVGKGDPVVFVHGTLGDYRTWGAQIDTFAINHRVIAYSRRFAYPNKQLINDSADYTPVPHAKDLAELIKALNLKPVHLVGHSYGAFTALLTTMDHPSLIRSLTLGEPPVTSLLENVAGGDTIMNNFFTTGAIPAVDGFNKNDSRKASAAFFNGALGDSLSWSKLSQQTQANMMDNTLELRGMLFSKITAPPLACADINKIQTPVLLLQGDKSPLWLTSIMNELDRCLNTKERAILSNSSHGLELENPLQFNKIVLEFIDKN